MAKKKTQRAEAAPKEEKEPPRSKFFDPEHTNPLHFITPRKSKDEQEKNKNGNTLIESITSSFGKRCTNFTRINVDFHVGGCCSKRKDLITRKTIFVLVSNSILSHFDEFPLFNADFPRHPLPPPPRWVVGAYYIEPIQIFTRALSFITHPIWLT